MIPSSGIFSVPLLGNGISKKEKVKDYSRQKVNRLNESPRKWTELDPTDEQTEAAAKLAFEMEEFNASSISEDKLRRVAGCSDLSTVTTIDMTVEASKNSSLEVLGYHLPCLQKLYLSVSGLCSLRDLGTNLRVLQTLSLVGAGLSELDGISALPCLRELLLSQNQLSDLTPLCTHDALQILDLSDNLIMDMDALEILGTCEKLYSLTLRGNPIEQALGAMSRSSDEANNDTGKGYKEVVMYHIPNLKVLDGTHLQFRLVDGSFISEALAFLSIYLSKHALDRENKNVIEDAPMSPWQAPLGQKLNSSVKVTEKVPDATDVSSSLTQLGQSFAGAPSALLRGRRGKNPALFASVPMTAIDNSEVLKGIEEERKLELSSLQSGETKKTREKRSGSRRRKKKVNDPLVSSSLDVLPNREQRGISNQSPSPTETKTYQQYDEEDIDMGEGGLMEAWRASRPCSSDDALPRMRSLNLTPSRISSWDTAQSPELAQSPSISDMKSRLSQEGKFMPANSLSFEAESSFPTRPHSAHTPASVPAFLMFQESPTSKTGEEIEPSCDDIDLSFKSVQRQFSGQRRRRKHRGRGWQNPLEFNDKLFVPPDTSASTWSVDKEKGVLKPHFDNVGLGLGLEEVDEDSDNEQETTRANLKARAQALQEQPIKTVAPPTKTRSFLDSYNSDEEERPVEENIKVKPSSPYKATSVDIEKRAPNSAPRAAGQLGFNLESSLQAIEQWTDVSELSQRKQKKFLEAAQNKQREAALLAKPNSLLAPPPDVSPECQDTEASLVRKSAVFRECQTTQQTESSASLDGAVGEGAALSDEELIVMLKQSPKHVPQLRTRDTFRNFFRGFSESRMRSLLEAACPDEKKVEKRYALVKDLLV